MSKDIDESGAFEKNIENIRYVGKKGNLIDDVIYEEGAWEPHILFFLKDSFQKTNAEGGVFLDIGANTGQHSLYMSQYANTVLAIKPYPPVLKRFREMISLNGFKNINIYAVGFSNKGGSLPYFAPSDVNLGGGGFDPAFTKGSKGTIELPLVVGDEYLKSYGISKIDLIKIDIEGYERYALQGLNNILSINRPIVVMELNSAEGGFKTTAQLVDTFPQKYSFFNIDGSYIDGSKKGSHWVIKLGPYRYIWGPGFKYRLEKFDFSFDKQANLAAIPNEKVALIMADR